MLNTNIKKLLDLSSAPSNHGYNAARGQAIENDWKDTINQEEADSLKAKDKSSILEIDRLHNLILQAAQPSIKTGNKIKDDARETKDGIMKIKALRERRELFNSLSKESQLIISLKYPGYDFSEQIN